MMIDDNRDPSPCHCAASRNPNAECVCDYFDSLPEVPIKLATLSFMDEHMANCTEAHCWLCSTMQRAYPLYMEQGIRRYIASKN